jgi:mRNA-degrading endonuclease toxin of MazEF toxin-antitoxin module
MNRWDIYWADVPFEEDSTQIKSRPVIIAKDNSIYALVIRITSQEARTSDPYDYPLHEWQYANLERPSVVRIRKIAQLKPDAIHDYIGRIHPADALEIQKCMDRFLRERTC